MFQAATPLGRAMSTPTREFSPGSRARVKWSSTLTTSGYPSFSFFKESCSTYPTEF